MMWGSSKRISHWERHLLLVMAGDCSAVAHQLHQVREIQGGHMAFAALLADGHVVTWGQPESLWPKIFAGATSVCWNSLQTNIEKHHNQKQHDIKRSTIQELSFQNSFKKATSNHKQLVELVVSFCFKWAISAVHFVVPRTGGDSQAVQGQLQDVWAIQAAGRAFSALRTDGAVVPWGDVDRGGDSQAVQDGTPVGRGDFWFQTSPQKPQNYKTDGKKHIVETVVKYELCFWWLKKAGVGICFEGEGL